MNIYKMEDKEWEEAVKEFNTILEYLPIEYSKKIPKEIREMLKESESKTYKPCIDIKKELSQQELKEETKDLIVYMYLNYWSNNEKKQTVEKKLMENEKLYEINLKNTWKDSLWNKK